MEPPRVRISDIAEELGLSTATVSNVIHGKTKKISDETVQRVQAMLEEKQYIPSMAGILLAQNNSRIIGFFVNDHPKYEGHTLDDAFIAASLNALCTQIESAGQFMMVKKAQKPEEVLQFASMWNMDGVVMMGFCRQDYMYLRSRIHIPFVVYDGFCRELERMVNITLDHRDGGRQVGQLFARTGHKRALCLADNTEGVDRERVDGFQQAFGAERTRFWLIPMQKAERLKFYRQRLEQLRQVSAIFAVSDVYAVELMQFLQQNGLSIPGQISIAGFDGIPLGEMVFPSLTTVRQDSALRAKVALEKLNALRNQQETETTVILPVTLVERDSTRRE